MWSSSGYATRQTTMSYSFDALTTATADTQRRATPNATQTTNLSGIAIMPLMPITAELAYRLGLQTAYELLHTITAETDIVEGDVLVVGSVEYPVRRVADWSWPGETNASRLLVVVEDLKR